MNNCGAVVVMLCLIVSLLSCIPDGKECVATRKIHKTGQTIADDDLIRTYESEHRKFHQENIKEGDHLEWPALDKKDLSNYCRKYLQQSIPTRTADGVTGTKFRKTLHYEKENANFISKIVIVQCKVQASEPLFYYITRAPEPNCIYDLKGSRKKYLYNIIHKYCDFEDKPIRYKIPKWKMTEMVKRIHRETGQPIANDKYLLAYELEHQEFMRKLGKSKDIEWPYAVVHHNLNSYCSQFIRQCAPRKNREGIRGRLKTVKLHYQKLNTNMDIYVTAVQCLTYNLSKQRYHMTRASETNCVYALLRNGNNMYNPLVIIFKHCDFEDPNDHPHMLQDRCDVPDNNFQELEEKKEVVQ